MARAWVDVTTQFASIYYRPAFGAAGAGIPGSAVAVINPAGPWPIGGSLEYAVFRDDSGDRHYELSGGFWSPSSASPPSYVYDTTPDPDFVAPGVLGLALDAPVSAYGARVTYRLVAADTSGATSMVMSVQPSTAEGTLASLPADPMTPGQFDDPWSTDDGETGWAVESAYTNNDVDVQIVERTPSDYARPVQVVIASVGGFTGPRETFDVQAGYLEIRKIELYMDVTGDFWTDFVNAEER